MALPPQPTSQKIKDLFEVLDADSFLTPLYRDYYRCEIEFAVEFLTKRKDVLEYLSPEQISALKKFLDKAIAHVGDKDSDLGKMMSDFRAEFDIERDDSQWTCRVTKSYKSLRDIQYFRQKQDVSNILRNYKRQATKHFLTKLDIPNRAQLSSREAAGLSEDSTLSTSTTKGNDNPREKELATNGKKLTTNEATRHTLATVILELTAALQGARSTQLEAVFRSATLGTTAARTAGTCPNNLTSTEESPSAMPYQYTRKQSTRHGPSVPTTRSTRMEAVQMTRFPFQSRGQCKRSRSGSTDIPSQPHQAEDTTMETFETKVGNPPNDIIKLTLDLYLTQDLPCTFLIEPDADAPLIQSQQSSPPGKSRVTMDPNKLRTVSRKGVLKTIVPNSFTTRLLKSVHTQHHHPNISKMTRLISAQYYWQNMTQDIAKQVKTCPTCRFARRIDEYKQPARKNTDTVLPYNCIPILFIKYLFIYAMPDQKIFELQEIVFNLGQAVFHCGQAFIKLLIILGTIFAENLNKLRREQTCRVTKSYKSLRDIQYFRQKQDVSNILRNYKRQATKHFLTKLDIPNRAQLSSREAAGLSEDSTLTHEQRPLEHSGVDGGARRLAAAVHVTSLCGGNGGRSRGPSGQPCAHREVSVNAGRQRAPPPPCYSI
ncbi:hypothetical protein LAZ67_9000770 [Cordylochernes scorpioides]|uniref:Integrase zinc-binding domain-containing protein n=1 Tax=Cordylochernes scorpioides TaxID=51811 RepID=A0ABY6KTC7_9ARAC|nr:hypothetical protein LAZ67_9000770 [Cordylochernes scorpioides]